MSNADIFLQWGDQDETETKVLLISQTPLSFRFLLPVPLGKKFNKAQVFDEALLVVKVIKGINIEAENNTKKFGFYFDDLKQFTGNECSGQFPSSCF